MSQQQQSTSAESAQTNEEIRHTCECTFPERVYDGVHHINSPNDFSYLIRNYFRNGKTYCLVCDKPIFQTSNAGGSCQQNTKEEKCVVICPLCDHPCEINGQPCGIHSEEACILYIKLQ
jgi:hypothetical protein